MKALTLDTQGLFTEAVRYLVPADEKRTARVSELFAQWTAAKPQGEIHSGYRRQILAREGLAESLELARELRERFDSMLVLGIGGSALGARTVLTGLQWQVPLRDRRRVFIADNLDPIEFETIWGALDPARTCFVIISKSGGTIETMAQASVVFERLKAQGLDYTKHVFAVTDPAKGALRNWVQKTGVRALNLPSDVGGRFSLLTPVGLLPIAFSGIDAARLLEGARDFFEGKFVPAAEMARTGARLAELEGAGFTGKVLMPYATILRDFGAWFVQLWGESLGKERKDGKARGSLPTAAVGATDQHSLLQMLVEGPNRMVTGFLRVENWENPGVPEARMSALPAEFNGLSFAYGKSFSEILNAEHIATEQVLVGRSRPVYRLTLDRVAPEGLGALFAFYMDLTVYAAAASEVNPFDQPGVELGKRILPELLK
jgi:glucose-6-phosphate isomerase